jgi:hypothetical protein
MHVGAVPHYGEEQGTTCPTTRVVQLIVADDEQRVLAVGELELLPLDSSERLESRAGRGATARAVTVRRIQELVRDPITSRATLTPPGQHALLEA